MVAAAYTYFHITFSRFNFINFTEWVFYTGDTTVFEPDAQRYLVVVYSSFQKEADEILKGVHNPKAHPVLLIDLSQSRKPSSGETIYLTAGMNTLLETVQRFHIRHSPSAFWIERRSEGLYKQASAVERL
ncbi:MAG: hypothetical protein AB7E49_05030 [Campylobacterales bacterium]